MKKKNKTLIIIVAIVILGAIGIYLNLLRLDREKFETNEKNLKSYISSIVGGNISPHETRHCARNNLKYSSGSLNCGFELTYLVNHTKITINQLNSEIYSFITQRLVWVDNGQNIQLMKESTGLNVSRSETYRVKDISCVVTTIDKNIDYEIIAACDGPAKHAWYPMKTN